MSTITLFAVAASSWGIAMALAPVLQIRHMLALRSSAGISVGYLAVLLVGFALWLAYGIALGNPVPHRSEHGRIRVCSATIAIALRFRRPA